MEEKQCTDCKYFCQHYAITGTNIIYTVFGHCRRNRASIELKKIATCKHWSQKKADKDYSETTTDIIKSMSKKLNTIAYLLKERE